MNNGKSTRARVGWADFLPMLTSHITSMGKRVAHPTLLIAFAFMLAGCAEQQRYQTIEQICVPDMDKAEIMQIAEDVMAKIHFTIDKADLDTGVIRTRPLLAAQFFEFWRSDNVSAFNAAEANLHSIRRIAQLDIKPQDNKIFISCDVQVQRLSVINPATCGQGSPPPQVRGLKEFPATAEMEWVDLGKDTQLATEILKRIERISSLLDARCSSLDIENRVSRIE